MTLFTSRAFYCSLYPFLDTAFVNNLPTQPVGTFIIFNVPLTFEVIECTLRVTVQYFDCVCMLVTIKSCRPAFFVQAKHTSFQIHA